MQPDRVTIPTALLQEIVRYLATRPLGDVLALYQAIQTEAKPVEQTVEQTVEQPPE